MKKLMRQRFERGNKKYWQSLRDQSRGGGSHILGLYLAVCATPLKYRELDERKNTIHSPSIPPSPPSIMTDTPTSNTSTFWQERNI